MEGLRGVPDFIITGGAGYDEALPILTIVEAKQENIDTGLAPCTAELYAAYLLNECRLPRVYGCVTTGTEWKFLCLEGERKIAQVDDETYIVTETARLLGVLCSIVDEALATLAASAEKATAK